MMQYSFIRITHVTSPPPFPMNVIAEEVNEIMDELDTNKDDRISEDEFIDAATHLECVKGYPTQDFNALIKLVARVYVGARDNEVGMRLG